MQARRVKRQALPPDEARRRRREGLIIAVTGVLFVIFAIFETRLPQLSNSSSPAGNVVFFLLINLNLILLTLLVYLVTRNLVKLVFDRRRRILGARLRSRLVFAFTVLTLFPTVSLFFVAQGFLTAAIENWFGSRVERSLASARDIAESYYQQAGNNALHHAHELSRQIQAQGLLGAGAAPDLQSFVEAKRRELNLGGIEVLAGRNAVATALPAELRNRLGPVAEADLDGVLTSGLEFARTETVAGGDLIRGGVPIRRAGGPIVGVVVVDTMVPRPLSKAAQRAIRANQEFRQLKVLEQPIKNGYLLTFLLITLVVMLSATWLGFYMAKGITVPIQRLGEGMNAVAQGNWNYRAEAGGDEEIGLLVGSFNQMTEDLQRIHSALEERHRYIENVLANIAAGVISIDASGAVATVNPAAGAMLGLQPEAVRGRPWREVFQGADLWRIGEIIARVGEVDEPTIERQIKLQTGAGVLTVLMTGTTLADETGARRGTMLFFEDVSHVLRVERMEAWREVARRIAHEIKNPLTPIQLSAQRLRKRYGTLLSEADGALLDECTRTIIGQVDELKRLVNEFSTFARLPAIEVAPHDLNAVVDEALVLFREGHRNIAFDFQADATLPPLEIDRDAIKRAVINMLDNAVAACHSVPTGEARIELATTHDPRVGVVRLEVADNGCGMAPQVKTRAFEPYFSTKKDGSGLGLAIVSAILADHQAYIRLRDNTPRGTRVVIEFPLRQTGGLRALGRA